MNTGRSLQSLAEELKRQKASKRDYLADTRLLKVYPTLGQSGVQLAMQDNGRFEIMPHAHAQLAEYTDIPKRYYDRMLAENPTLLSENVNCWLVKKAEPRMVRTLDGALRAFLSPRYRTLDSYDLGEVALEEIAKGGADVVSCDITALRMHIKALTPITAEVKRGDVVQAGIAIANSEVGYGALAVSLFIKRLVCENGMTVAEEFRKHHLGRALDADENSVRMLLSDEAKAADDRAIWLKVRDVIRASMSSPLFGGVVERMRAAAEDRLVGSPIKAIELISEKYQLGEAVQTTVMQNLIEGGDLTRWGVLNAVTRAAGTVEDYEEATRLEAVGGQILELPPTDWKVIKEAA